MNNYKELKVWQKAVDLAVKMYNAIDNCEPNRIFRQGNIRCTSRGNNRDTKNELVSSKNLELITIN
jgi:hypothetical protein